MTTKDPFSPHVLLSDALRVPIERQVSQHLGRAWRIETVEDRNDCASHPAAILSDGVFAVFTKLGQKTFVRDQFAQELIGLRLLAERSGVLTPKVIGNVDVEDGVIMILEAVQVVERKPRHWRQMGHALALIHRTKWDRCGLETHSYWGDLYQDNQPIADWPGFYRDRRLLPRLRMAIDSGHVPRSVAKQIEKLIARLPELCGPDVQPTLLHGDAHQNNFLSTHDGAVLIDPAVYYGHPEIDLAYVDLFSPVPDELFEGYQEMGSIDPGFRERRDLWLVSAWLGLVAMEASYLDKLIASVRKYL
jgi:fructosamine-3-kinase